MCAVSMVMDTYKDHFIQQPWFTPTPSTSIPSTGIASYGLPVTRLEFEALKNEMLLLKKLVEAAKIYDVENNEPDCEMDEKTALIKKLAEFVGVEIDVK